MSKHTLIVQVSKDVQMVERKLFMKDFNGNQESSGDLKFSQYMDENCQEGAWSHTFRAIGAILPGR